MSATMSLLLLAGIIKTALIVWASCKLYRLVARRWRNRLAYEYASGNLGVRRRIQHTIGRRNDTLHTALRAETMPGYLWFYWTRRAGEGFRERTGWALTKRAARRRAAAAAERDQHARGSARR